MNTPLNTILGYAEMFKEAVYGPMNDKQVNMADRIVKNTQRLLGLINDLLDQAQMEAGKLTINMNPVKPANSSKICMDYWIKPHRTKTSG